jgi:hypothetical protein
MNMHEILFSPLKELIVAASLMSPLPLAAGPSQIPLDNTTVVTAARDAAVRALTFRQGDRDGFTRAQASFTPEGQAEFLKTMGGWLDGNGAPTFSSSFVPSGDGRVVDSDGGVVHVRIPGALTHTQNQSRTTYRVAVDIWASARPVSIRRLTQTTCLGGSRACD